MKRRKPTILILEILSVLQNGPLSLRAIDIKLNTSSRSIKEYCTLLQKLGLVKLKQKKLNGKIATYAELTKQGTKLKQRSI